MSANEKRYDLEGRTYDFALRTRELLKSLSWSPISWSDVQQLLRSSGSVAANFVEAAEALSNEDFLYRVRLCKKESKESGLWLRLLRDSNELPRGVLEDFQSLERETGELVLIFAAIIRKRSASI
jgi:four helix bundle protein